TGLSVARFGWSNHVDYVAVLRSIGQQGEVFWPNQSINGLLHRFLGNGDPVNWTGQAYAAYSAKVYFATVASSLVLLGLAFGISRRFVSRAELDRVDFAVVLLAVTMASPVAWEHHYGILLPIYAAILPILLESRPLGRWTGAVVIAGFAA